MSNLQASKIVLQTLIDGNHRFLNGIKSATSSTTPERLKYLSKHGQSPSCVVLTCSDSRVPTELIFDQGLGDLFVVRVAGNVVAPSLIASMEFSVEQFKSPLLLVLGHTKCGAIHAACNAKENEPALSKNLADLMMRIKPAVEKSEQHTKNKMNFIDACTIENVYNSIAEIKKNSPLITQQIANKELQIIGAIFELESGRVLFFKEAQNILGDDTSKNLHLCTN